MTPNDSEIRGFRDGSIINKDPKEYRYIERHGDFFGAKKITIERRIQEAKKTKKAINRESESVRN